MIVKVFELAKAGRLLDNDFRHRKCATGAFAPTSFPGLFPGLFPPPKEKSPGNEVDFAQTVINTGFIFSNYTKNYKINYSMDIGKYLHKIDDVRTIFLLYQNKTGESPKSYLPVSLLLGFVVVVLAFFLKKYTIILSFSMIQVLF